MQLLRRQVVSQMLGISLPTLARLIARGEIDALKVGRQVRIREEAVIAYLEKCKLEKEGISVSDVDHGQR